MTPVGRQAGARVDAQRLKLDVGRVPVFDEGVYVVRVRGLRRPAEEAVGERNTRACEQRGHGVGVLHEGDTAYGRESAGRYVPHPVSAHAHHVWMDVVDEFAFVTQPAWLSVLG
jgi:hypothetical protein